jgi:dimethylglycine dehydrogenase
LNWLEEQRRAGAEVCFDNVSEFYGVLMLAGPLSREILAACTDSPLDNQTFRWLSARQITVAGVDRIRTLRVSYTGELGWELHIPMAGMQTVYDALVAVGKPLGLVHVGSATLNAMRMEKAYKSGHELTNEVTLAEADLRRFARPDGFQGAAITLAQAERWALAYIRLDEPPDELPNADPLGSESIWINGEYIGTVASGGFAYSVNAYLLWAYVKPAYAAPGTVVEVMTLGFPRRGVVLAETVWDPQNQRPRG